MYLRKVELDHRGHDYVVNHLRDVNGLCDALAEVVQNEGGRVFTFVPHDVTEDRIYAFERGGLLRENFNFSNGAPLGPGQGFLVPVADLADIRANVIMEELNAHRGAICLCDDFNPRWSEDVARSTADTFGVGEETYHLLTPTSGIDAIAQTLRFTDTIWHGTAAVCAAKLEISPQRTASKSALSACARTVLQLTCTAYRREGFVVWRRIGV